MINICSQVYCEMYFKLVFSCLGLCVTLLKGEADRTFFGVDEVATLSPSGLSFKKSSALHCAMACKKIGDSCEVFSFNCSDQTCSISSYMSMVTQQPLLRAAQNSRGVSQFLVSI